MAQLALRLRVAPCGLSNRKNNCFFNSAMQCLVGIPELAYFYTKNDFEPTQKYSLFFQNFLKKMISQKNSYIEIEEFIPTLRTKIKLFDGNEQDAHEFLIYFLEILSNELGKRNEEVIDNLESYNEFLKTNIIIKTLFGMQSSNLKCTQCDKTRFCYENFIILSLNVKNSISDSIKEFLKEELIMNIFCENCNLKTNFIKYYGFSRMPKILIIHLKRFIDYRNKDNTCVNVDNVLKINEFTYRLVSYVCHSGTIRNGHYVAYGERNNEWYCFDDRNCYKSDNRDESNAYVLFYSRV